MFDKVLIVDLQIPGFDNGKLFDPNYAILPGLELYPLLHAKALNSGIICLTPDQFLENSRDYLNKPKFGLSYEGKKSTVEFFNKYDIKKFIVYCGEAPTNSKHFYRNLGKKIKGFSHIFAFSGVVELIKNSEIEFHNFNWPNCHIPINGLNWQDRRLITFIVSPKAKFNANFSRFSSRMIRFPRYYYNKIKYFFNQKQFGVDITQYRRDAIRYFAPSSDFQLFGKGWDLAVKYDPYFSKINFKNKPEPVLSKISEISKSKFTFCFENTLFPGYITEKIFDAMLGGSVPVWRGCDEVYNVVPIKCFIDAKEFSSFANLDKFLHNISHKSWIEYRNNIIEFLNSENYMRYTGEAFSNQIIRLINNQK